MKKILLFVSPLALFTFAIAFEYPSDAELCTRPEWTSSRACVKDSVPINTELSYPKLVYRVFGEDNTAEKQTMVVFLHGDSRRNTSSNPSAYLYNYAEQIAKRNHSVIGAAIIRPGYYGPGGVRSPGRQHRGSFACTPINNATVAYNIAQLKKQYGVKKVIAVGHSAGAQCIGAIIGRTTGLIDVAVMVAGAYYVPRWREHRIATAGRRSRDQKSESPHNFLDKIPNSVIVRAITGAKDVNTLPQFAEEYIAELKQRDIDAELKIVPGAGHCDRRGCESVMNPSMHVVQSFL